MNNDFFDLLTKEHEQVKDLLEQLKETDESEEDTREQLFKKLKSELIPHLKAEEAAYYPILIDEDQSREQALEAKEEHHAAELILYELEKLSKKNERWGAKLSVFKEMVEHHIEEEQEELFDVTKEVLDDEAIEGIMKNFKKEKQNSLKQMSEF